MKKTIAQQPGQSPTKAANRWPLHTLVFIVWLVASSAGITQYAASRLAYHPALGEPIFGHVYVPWAWLIWQWTFQKSATATWAICYVASLISIMVGLLALVFAFGGRRSARKQEGLHGTAHWADEQEITDSGLLPTPGKPGQGVYVGGWTDRHGNLRYLRHNGPEHVAALAATRSGKGVALVVPTLLSWPGSCVVNDQKHELWAMTAGMRSQQLNNRCMLFNPGSEDQEGTVGYNPLQEIRIGTPKEVGDTQNLATMLVDPNGEGLKSHWDKTGHAFLVGVILHLMHKNRLRVASFVNAGIARALALKVSMLQQQFLDVDNATNQQPSETEAKRRTAVLYSTIEQALKNPPADAAWRVLDDIEQAAVQLYHDMPAHSRVDEILQWADDGNRWKQQTPAEKKAITTYNEATSEAQRVELQRRMAARPLVALPDITLTLSDPRRPIDDLYAEMMENTHDVTGLYATEFADVIKHPGQHPLVASGAAAMLNRPDDERGSVLSTAQSFLALYADPIVARNVRRSDFKISDLMNSDKPVTLYLAAREEDKDRLKPLMRLMINQIVRVLLRPALTYVDGKQQPPHKHRLLLMLDEFPSYGKLEIFEEALSYIAGYGIKAYLIMQDIAQLWKHYGKDESIISNCHIRVAYAPNKIETAEWLSKTTGKTTIQTEEFSESGKKFGAVLDGISRNWKATERELMTPDEAMRMKAPIKDKEGKITAPGDLVVFVAGHAPIYGTQSLYFRDPVFVERVKLKPPATADSEGRPAQVQATTAAAAPPASSPFTPFVIDGASIVMAPATGTASSNVPAFKIDAASTDPEGQP